MAYHVEPSHPPGPHLFRGGSDGPPVLVPPPVTDAFREARRLDALPLRALLDDVDASRRYGTRLGRTGRLRALADFAEELERAGWRRRDDSRRALASLFGGRAALERGRLSFARVRFERICARRPSSSSAGGRIVCLARAGLGEVARLGGMPLRALRRLRGAPAGGPGALAEVHRGLGAAYVDLGCPDAAAAKLRHGLGLARDAGDPLEASLVTSRLAAVELDRSGPARAGELAGLALRRAETSGSPLARAEAMAVSARVDARGGTKGRTAALRRLSRALALALETGAVLLEARLHAAAGRILRKGGRDDAAVRRLSRARAVFAEAGARGPGERVERWLEELE